MSRVVHFEIHAKERDKMQKFYQDCFGWEFQGMGEDFGGYRVIITGKEGLGINGGMTERRGELPKAGDAVNAYVCVIGVENIDETIKKIEAAGGQVALAKMDVPNVGLLAYYRDPEENIFGVIQPDPASMPAK